MGSAGSGGSSAVAIGGLLGRAPPHGTEPAEGDLRSPVGTRTVTLPARRPDGGDGQGPRPGGSTARDDVPQRRNHPERAAPAALPSPHPAGPAGPPLPRARATVPAFVATIPPPPINGFELGPLDVRLYGVLIALGAYLALRLTVKRYAALGGDTDVAERILLWTLGAGFLGARIGYVIPRVGDFVDSPLSIFAIWEGGLALFGGIFLGTAVAILLARRWGADVPALATAAAPAVPLAQAIGRWGNYFNQELYGRPTDVPWALEVEPAFRRQGFEQFSTFHPTFLYESLWNATLVGVLLWLDRRGTLKRGSLFLVYLIGYGVGRGWIESLRVDTVERYLGLSRNNWLAIAIVLAGSLALWWWQRRPEPDAAVVDTDDTTDAQDDDEVAPSEVDDEVAPSEVDDEVDDPRDPEDR
ncbi:prolipoprotein diacylglyceryl transferase [Nitriliruptoraceae bacterium ZYF776]|nr:prolipoprotein diacylglyceryl transferase [Profundirhabdus halotolerans]